MDLRSHELRPFWNRLFDFDWKFGLFLLLIICIPRFILVLQANQHGNYSYMGLVMTISALVPFLFLSKHGRRTIGLTAPKNYPWLIISIIAGVSFSFLLYQLGDILYGSSYENWYKYIGKPYHVGDINPKEKFFVFAIIAFVSMTFSPIGEELFFRGLVHSSFAKSIGSTKASIVDGIAFSLTHISHFGLVFIHDQWDFYFFPTILWVVSMFAASILFYICKLKTGSLLGATLSHAAFNVTMIYCIFYLID